MSNDAIKYELGLTIVATVVFGVWQWWELKRDGKLLRERRERERAQERAEQAAQAKSADPPGP